jgi:hypothetical protein
MLCTKLDTPILSYDLEEGQEILREHLTTCRAGCAVCTKLDAPDILEEGQEILRYN